MVLYIANKHFSILIISLKKTLRQETFSDFFEITFKFYLSFADLHTFVRIFEPVSSSYDASFSVPLYTEPGMFSCFSCLGSCQLLSWGLLLFWDSPLRRINFTSFFFFFVLCVRFAVFVVHAHYPGADFLYVFPSFDQF